MIANDTFVQLSTKVYIEWMSVIIGNAIQQLQNPKLYCRL